jgi:hypothetical protein
MQRRQWTPKPKPGSCSKVYRVSLWRNSVTRHQINQSQYDPWRDQFLANASKAFEVHQDGQKDARLARENARLKTLVGELTLELLIRTLKAKVRAVL